MKILNLEQFLAKRGLNHKVIVGTRFAGDRKGKPSQDRFYIINSSLEEIKAVKKVWTKGVHTKAVMDALGKYDIHETKTIFTETIEEAMGHIFAEGKNAYSAYLNRYKDEEVETDKVSKKFMKLFKENS